mmetsp:Transcript_8971/g.18750  ORF Transcript_8971/g.18750 Transcript_8971/m.18750 type:complete len:366 (-) Transcript_8971:113-1210(-)
MDLFGDLPSAKNTSVNTHPINPDIKSNDESENPLFGGLPPSSSTASHATGGSNAAAVAGSKNAASISHSNANNSKNTDVNNAVPKSNGKGSLVSSLGVAGTSMAFVPAAIAQARKRKKMAQGQQPSQTKMQKVQEQPSDNDIQNLDPEEPSKETDTHNTIPENGREVAIEDDDQKMSSRISQNSLIDTIDSNRNDTALQHEEQDPPHLRHLHASVTPEHTYNPHFPNDYLAYRERKKTERLRKDLEREARERLEKQEMLRKRIEEERRKIEESGDLEKIVESRLGSGTGQEAIGAGRGRGRGRGVNNLPAWLIQKRQEAKDANMGRNSTDAGLGDEVAAEEKNTAELPENLSSVVGSDGQFDDAK